MFINMKTIFGLFTFATAVSALSTLKVVDVSERVASDSSEASPITMKAGYMYDVSDPEVFNGETGYLTFQCPAVKKHGKRATVSYLTTSFEDDLYLVINGPDGKNICALAGYEYEDTYAYGLCIVTCYNGRVQAVSYTYE